MDRKFSARTPANSHVQRKWLLYIDPPQIKKAQHLEPCLFWFWCQELINRSSSNPGKGRCRGGGFLKQIFSFRIQHLLHRLLSLWLPSECSLRPNQKTSQLATERCPEKLLWTFSHYTVWVKPFIRKWKGSQLWTCSSHFHLSKFLISGCRYSLFPICPSIFGIMIPMMSISLWWFRMRLQVCHSWSINVYCSIYIIIYIWGWGSYIYITYVTIYI